MPSDNGRSKAEQFRVAEISYSAPERVELTLDILLVSPLYGGGVEAGQLDPITPFRASSIRGNLRYWWRATRGGQFDTWEKMRDAEAAIWGDTEQASRVQLRVQIPENWAKGRVLLRKYERDLNRKYALFPPYNQKNVNLDDPGKQFLESGRFSVTLSLQSEKLSPDVNAAIWAWTNFGGLGARTRRGAGALFCERYAGWDEGHVAGDGKTRPWSTLKGGKIVWGPPKKGTNAWADAWTEVVQLYREFRQDRIGRGPTAWPEPDEIRAIRQGSGKASDAGFPRGSLGLPIVFHFKDRSEPSDQTLSIAEEGRMASPVILRPFAASKDLAYPVILLMNSPGPQQLYLYEKGGRTQPVTGGIRNSLSELLNRAHDRWGAGTMAI